MSIILERRICIDHKYLDSNIHSYLLEKIKEVTLNECTKENGYILSIIKIVKIKDSYISNANCDNIFTILFEVENLKPENGKQFEGEVCMIFGGGIFINVKKKQKILIPISNLKNYVFIPTLKQFKNEKIIIKEGDILNVEIIGTKYTKQSFSCFGKLI